MTKTKYSDWSCTIFPKNGDPPIFCANKREYYKALEIREKRIEEQKKEKERLRREKLKEKRKQKKQN